MIGLLVIIQFTAIAQVDTIPAERLKALAQDDSIPAKPLSSIPKDERTPSIVPDKAYFKSWLTDGRDILISPYRWNKYQWIAVTGVAAFAIGLYTQDLRIQRVVQHNQTSSLSDISTYGLKPWGSTYAIPALGILYGVGALMKDDKARYTALKGAEAYVFGFIAGQVMKQLTHRDRPVTDDPANPYIWGGPFKPFSNSSFPSGHTTIVFAVATVVATSYAKNHWVPIACYTLAGLTAASRVYNNDHWFSDVFVGAAIGFAIGRTIMNNHIKKIKVLPISHVGSGIMLVYQID